LFLAGVRIMEKQKLSLGKQDRLCHHKLISRLFKEGAAYHAWPINLIWLGEVNAENPPAQVMFAVPKRNFKHANKRNLLRRRMKEAYRQLKPEFYQHLEQHSQQGVFAFVYIGNVSLEYKLIQDKIILLLQRLKEVHEKAAR